MKLVAVALCAAGVLSGCSGLDLGDEGSDGAPASPSPSATGFTVEQGGRGKTGPAGVRLVFETSRHEQKMFERAVRSLVRVHAWRRLTKGIYSVEMETHPGARSEAGVHLADAVLNHTIADDQPRVVCDIRFYPRAIRQELRLWGRLRDAGVSPREWRDYNSNGSFDEPVPSKGDFWAAILAHELAHCLVGPHGEKAAQKWEYRTIRKLS